MPRLQINSKYIPGLSHKGRFLLCYGGAGSGKSYFAAQKHLLECLREGERVLVLRKVYRTCRQSTFQLLQNVIGDADLGDIFEISRGDMTIQNVRTGSDIIHAGLDDVNKLKSITGVTKVWMEEATEMSKADFDQVNLRLRGADAPTGFQISLSFNPVPVKWLKDFVEDPPPGTMIIHSTHKDNPFVGDEFENVLEALEDENMRKIYARGEWGELVKGQIFSNWKVGTVFPDRCSDIVYGVDFGFNNPTVVLKVGRIENVIFIDEVLRETHITNGELIERLKGLIPQGERWRPMYCDSAEPQRIEEISRAGFNAHPSDKDVNKGIDSVRAYSIEITARSKKTIEEFGLYRWMETKDGIPLDKPEKVDDHAPDAARYAIHTAFGLPRAKELLTSMINV